MASLVPTSRSVSTSTLRSHVCRACFRDLSRSQSRSKSTVDLEQTYRKQFARPSAKDTTATQRVEADDFYSRNWEGVEWVGTKRWLWDNSLAEVPQDVKRFAAAKPLAQHLIRDQVKFALMETFLAAAVRRASTKSSSSTPRKSPIQSFGEVQNTFLKSMPILELHPVATTPTPHLEFISSPEGPQLLIGDRRILEGLRSTLLSSVAKAKEALVTDERALSTLLSVKGQDYWIDGLAWDQVSLVPLDFRFALLSRVYNRTGHRLPDSLIALATTPKQLIYLLVEKPTIPKKVHQLVKKRGELGSTPNVSFRARALTRQQKDVEKGRWKLIEEELRRRDLPVSLRGVLDKSNRRRNAIPKP